MAHRALFALIALSIGAAAPSAQAFSLSDLDPTKIIRSLTKAKVNVHNYYSYPITVVMDSNRESHRIAPGGVATFTKANKGDRPTFRAHRDSVGIVNTKSVFLDGNKTVNFQ